MEFFFTKSLVFIGFNHFGTEFLCSGSALGRTEPNFQIQVQVWRQKCRTWTEPDRGQSSSTAWAILVRAVRCTGILPAQHDPALMMHYDAL